MLRVCYVFFMYYKTERDMFFRPAPLGAPTQTPWAHDNSA